jgi:hypothetical protein
MSASLKTTSSRGHLAHIRLLEAAESATRDAFGCAFSTADEYETALITERRAEGRYAQTLSPMVRNWPTIALGCFAGVLLAAYLILS